ncbi:MAG: ECF transporter S component [Clostridia bacterium]
MGNDSKGRQNRTLMLALSGMMAALVFVATYFFRLPVSITQGYIHLGDGFILLGASLLGWMAVPAAAIGSMLADLLAGYTLYCLPTLLIKGAVAAVGVLAVRGEKPYWVTLLLLIVAELVMVAGYFMAEWLVLGYGLAAASAAVIPNLVQGLSGVVVGAVLIPLMKRVKLPGLQ